ncbi:exostosin domain-containing protein [Hyphomicrobium methylovorum]|uniref:exostosin domain-containing protein n=1 Tax=Hyphomicrobium methylovorum TaxID=84 RepID=UPI0015E6DE5F|nr:exostosin family protein [Hyphomicrobium methylovorum]
MQSIEIPLGVPRCDNRIAYIFKINGWRVVNPFGAIIAGHAHETQIRTYDKKRDTTIIGGVAYVHPCEPSGTSDIDIDVWMLDDANVKSLKINKWLMQWHSEPRSQPAVKETTRPTASPVRQGKLKSNGQTVQIAKLEKQRDLAAIKPVLDIDIAIKQYSKGSGDPHFWQYPCFTEKQAFENHDTIPVGSHIDERTRTVHTYLALPWATYIDLQAPINETLDTVRKRVNSARKTAHQAGYRLRVHTVCQHYAWHRLKSAFSLVGVTDLHLAHCTSTLLAESRPSFRFHSWPLFAPNIENSYRSRGTQVGVHPKKKSYLASFIGSHMKHYRSETRLALEHAAIADGGSDILVELTSIWHFNQSVYDEQVKGKTLSADSQSQQLQAAERYNRLLSNSVFSLCPDGAGPNTLRTWESLAVGSIPVIIADDWAPPNLNGRDLSDACLFVERSDIPTLFDRLRSIPDAELAERMRACFDCYFAARNMTAFGAHDFEEMENPISAKAARNSNNLVEVPA